jgi:hypothetical protein
MSRCRDNNLAFALRERNAGGRAGFSCVVSNCAGDPANAGQSSIAELIRLAYQQQEFLQFLFPARLNTVVPHLDSGPHDKSTDDVRTTE